MYTMQAKLDALGELLEKLQSKDLPEGELSDLQEAHRLLEDIRVEEDRVREEIQRMNRSKAKFVSMVSHELRIPLTSIKGYADLLLQRAVGPLNEQQINFLDVIRNNVGRMAALISSLSDLSKLETGRLQLDVESFPLRQQIDMVVTKFHPRINEKAQSLEVEIDPDLPKVYGDKNRVIQVISVLIDNAYRYTPYQGKIHISANRQGDVLRVVLEDDGIGIHPREQEKVFTQFFRSEEQVVREEQGWGLGLALSKALVEQMGGQIGFESVLDKGSTFWFTLPTSEINHQSEASD